ncbi:acyltransferase domain-containing protein, partial [Streptosporangium subroseum]|uniref:acyltransferase domain-containing protein n=1 Tax=Streptosporangium subroseum TaxID=106412 RepID=UPI00308467C8
MFADAFDQVALHVEAHLDRPLADVLADEELIHQTGYAQPTLFAVEVALHALLRSWGIAPDVLVGHSIGEIAAAQVAGVLTLADAATLVAARGRLMQALPSGGAMLAVGAAEADVRALLASMANGEVSDGHLASVGGDGSNGSESSGGGLAVVGGDESHGSGFAFAVDVAAVNGPASVVVSGAEGDIDRVAELAAERGWKTSRLRTSHAFHSRLMEPMLAEFRAVVAQLSFAEPVVSVVSTVTGRPVESGLWSDPEYWVEQVRKPVRFADALAVLEGVSRFVELGPDGVLAALVQQPDAVAVPLLRRDRDEVTTALTALATLHVNGVSVDWSALFAGVQPVELPTYAFQRQRYWLRTRAEAPIAAADAGLWDLIDRGDFTKLAAELGVDPSSSLERVLPALTSWRVRGRERSRLDGWRYHIAWQPVPEPGPVALVGTWVLIGADPVGLAAALTSHGARVLAVGTDERSVLAQRLRELDGPVAGVVSLAALEDTPLLDSLAVVQAYLDAELAAPLWLVTRGAVSVGRADAPASPIQAQTWGFGRAVGLEHPEFWGGLLDLPVELDRRAAA